MGSGLLLLLVTRGGVHGVRVDVVLEQHADLVRVRVGVRLRPRLRVRPRH